MTFAMKLKRLRTARGLTQMALADRLRMKQPYLVELEAGRQSNPKLSTLQRLAKALKVSVGKLVE